jgi:hypothetical protein
MKKIFISGLLLTTCCSNIKENNTVGTTSAATTVEVTTDDVIAKSDSISKTLHEVTTNTDRVLSKKIAVDKQKIHNIIKELQITKSENEILKDQITKVKTIIITDTIFINETKNFWGKKKTTVIAVKDSTSSEEITE